MTPDFIPPHPDMPRTFTAAQLMTAELPPRELIVDPILAAKGLAMIYGPRGLGKTFVALGIAWAAASGASFLKWRATRPHRVLYVDGEMPAADMKDRLRMLGSAPDTLKFMMADLSPHGMPDLGVPAGQRLFEPSWSEEPELIVLDNISSLVGQRSEDPDGWNTLQSWLLKLRRRGTSVLLVHHANKDGQQRGTSRREDVLDIVLALRRPVGYEANDGARFEVHFEKVRGIFGDVTDPFEAHLKADDVGVSRWSWRPINDAQLTRLANLLNDGLGAEEVAEEMGISRASAYRLRKQAIGLGLVGE